VPPEDRVDLWELLRRERDRLPPNKGMPGISQKDDGRKPKDCGDCKDTDIVGKNRMCTQPIRTVKNDENGSSHKEYVQSCECQE
jgi:hypothetical protein